MTFLELLLSEKNISGVWLVVGGTLTASFAFLGVFINNLFENGRKKKEREHALIQESYMGAVEYANYMVLAISGLSNVENKNVMTIDASVTAKYYKLFLIASPEVIEAFSQFYKKSNKAALDLTLVRLQWQNCDAAVHSYQQEFQNALNMMNRINEDREEYNRQKNTDKELWQLYERNFQKEEDIFDSAMVNFSVANKNRMKAHMLLLREQMDALSFISSDLYNSIISMRHDLDRKLNKQQRKAMQKSIDGMLKQMQSDIQLFIEKIDSELERIMLEEEAEE